VFISLKDLWAKGWRFNKLESM